jgi:hypothetical protein
MFLERTRNIILASRAVKGGGGCYIRAGIRADYATLKASTDYLSANQTELRLKMIASTQRLWESMLETRNTFSDVVSLEHIAFAKELEGAFAQGSLPKLLARVNSYKSEPHLIDKITE